MSEDIEITLESLADGAVRQSAQVDLGRTPDWIRKTTWRTVLVSIDGEQQVLFMHVDGSWWDGDIEGEPQWVDRIPGYSLEVTVDGGTINVTHTGSTEPIPGSLVETYLLPSEHPQ